MAVGNAGKKWAWGGSTGAGVNFRIPQPARPPAHVHTLALQAGVAVKVVSEMLGQASVTITYDTYSHVIPSVQEDATSKVAALLSSAQLDRESRLANPCRSFSRATA